MPFGQGQVVLDGLCQLILLRLTLQFILGSGVPNSLNVAIGGLESSNQGKRPII